MGSKVFKLSSTHDLDLTGQKLSAITEVDRVARDLKIRLLRFLGEWFLDNRKGVDYWTIIEKGTPLVTVEVLLRQEILDTKDVTEILEFDLVIEKVGNNKVLTVTFSVNTTFGIITDSLNQTI